MRFIDAETVERVLSYPMLVDVLSDMFRDGAIAPPRHHHTIPLVGRPDATWLLMPAITQRGTDAGGRAVAGPYMGLKAVTAFPDNGARAGKPAIFGMYLLNTTETGETIAVIDATRLTVWRTAAASALAARHLSRPDASRFFMIGTGALAPYLIRAHASVRPIHEIRIWNRDPAKATAIAGALARDLRLDIRAEPDLEKGCRWADTISTATLSFTPLVHGRWLRPGTHVDCVGAYRKDMRETDDDAVAAASVFCDTFPGAFGEAGDILQPIASGRITREHVRADLASLVRGDHPGRSSPEEITLFKSVGASIEDLTAAVAVYDAVTKN